MLFKMRILLTCLFLTLPLAAGAQVLPAPETLPAPEALPVPKFELDPPEIVVPPLPETESAETESQNGKGEEGEEIAGEDIVPESLEPDYSQLSPQAERTARLNELFEKLALREEEEDAKLVAEEIMAIWVDSGSASVNLLLRRGSDSSAKGNPKLARKMYNYAVDLSPNYAEAWARSARLAFAQKDFNRALNESLKTLSLEPRHFYALWTLGNVLETLDRSDEALEAYREAARLYPALKVVKDRLESLEGEVEGTVL